jgi:hypothetical protein
MADDFSSFDDDSFDDTPDWLLDDQDENSVSDAGAEVEDDDEFEQLRQKSARSGSMYDEMEADNQGQSGSSSFSWSSFSSGQRLVLALLIVLDILAIGLGVLVLAGIV